VKIAHIIPPNALLMVEDLLGDYQLCLPSLMRDSYYRHFYQRRAAESDDNYTIMDNGAAEKGKVDFAHLLHMSTMLGAKEVVLPDVLYDSDSTLGAGIEAFTQAFNKRARFKYMFVCQGTSVPEMVHCAEQAMNMMPGVINAFGIPRHILSKSPDARLEVAQRLWARFPQKPIHLLGTHPWYPFEIKAWAVPFGNLGVRGVDTSLAWNAARQGAILSRDDTFEVPIERQEIEEFIGAYASTDDLKLLRENMEYMDSWMK
jgi:hypothetical protein